MRSMGVHKEAKSADAAWAQVAAAKGLAEDEASRLRALLSVTSAGEGMPERGLHLLKTYEQRLASAQHRLAMQAGTQVWTIGQPCGLRQLCDVIEIVRSEGFEWDQHVVGASLAWTEV